MNIEQIKIKLEKLMQNQDGKVIFAKKIGKRNEYIFSIGKTNFEPSETIFENKNYILFSEGVSDELQSIIKQNLNI